jgi:glycosyltransferase involved in cell wall biosynthesis
MSAAASTPEIEQEQRIARQEEWIGVRICHISSVQTDFDARIFHRQCAPLADGGMDVSFLGPHSESKYTEGVKVVATIRRHNRFIRMLSTPLLLAKALRLKADFYFLNDPELLPIGILLKLLSDGKVVYDSREDYPDMMLTKEYVPGPLRPLLAHSLALLERLCAGLFDGIMTADAATLSRVARVGTSKKLVLYNFPSLQVFSPAAAIKRYDFVYRGGLSARAGTPVLLEALAILLREGHPAKTLIIGYVDTPAEWNQMVARIEELGLKDWIELSGRISHDKMSEALSQARIGICPLLPIPKFLRNIPVKVFEYWACGLSVIASDLPPIRPFFKDGENGILVEPGDPRCLADAMKTLLQDPAKSAQMGRVGREAVENRLNSKCEFYKLMKFLARMGE